MATSGTFTGTRGASAYGPWLILEWDRIATDIPNNRSQIRLTLKLASDRNIQFSATKSGVLDGTSFSYTGNYSGPETRTIKTKDVWVNHDSDGGRSEAFSASFDVDITWSGEWLGRLTVSGTAVITDIPRASDFTSFTLSNTVLNTSTATTINYTIGSKSSSFSQDMTLKYAGKVIASWNTGTTANGALTRTLSSTEVNAIISAMSSVTSGTLSLNMQTKSGSTNIGSVKTINEGISLNAAIKPSASGLTTAIAGTGRDKTLNKYVQNVSKVTSSFTRTAGYGASISSSTITVKRKSDGGNSQTIASNSGTTANVLTLSGVYSVTGTVKDSRGRTATVTADITIDAYSPPKITTFAVSRTSANTANMLATINTSWSLLGTSNTASITVTGTSAAGVVQSLYTLTNSAAGVLNTTQTYTAQSDASSFLYILSVTDSFGNRATADVTVGTSFIELTIAKGLGVGVGKVHQKGSLDVAGEAYIQGKLVLQPPTNLSEQPRLQIESKDLNGHGYIELFGPAAARKAYIGIPSATVDYLTIANTIGTTSGFIHLGPRNFNLRDLTATYDGVPVFTAGNPVIWVGGAYVSAGQTISPTKKLSECPNGWILVWSAYSGGSVDNDFNITIIPKSFATEHSGKGLWCTLQANSTTVALKYIYVTDTGFTGQARNSLSPQTLQVLREVLAY